MKLLLAMRKNVQHGFGTERKYTPHGLTRVEAEVPLCARTVPTLLAGDNAIP